MRGKTSKRYRKLMQQFSLHFGFREPYQVLVDSQIILDAARFTMDLTPALERTLHGQTKPMITQCGYRNLHRLLNPQQQSRTKDGEKKSTDKKPSPHNQAEVPASFSREAGTRALETAKAFERRRCGHRPEEYPEPLSDAECIASCVDGGKGKSAGENKHRYVVATQSLDLRRTLRAVRGVPLMYIKRSVMILEPMAEESVAVGAKSERLKFKQGITSLAGAKRKREGDDGDDGSGSSDDDDDAGNTTRTAEREVKKKKKNYGKKGANPLSMKKSAKGQELSGPKNLKSIGAPQPKKRKRKPKTKEGAEGSGEAAPVTVSVDD